MSPLKWFFLSAFLISAYWLWPLYVIAGIIWMCVALNPDGGSYSSSYRPSRRRRATPKYKPYKIKFKKRVVYKAPKYRYKKPKPRPKGRKLKDGNTQYMKKMGSKRYWTPHSRWKDLPD
jgi:hypothetical protein